MNVEEILNAEYPDRALSAELTCLADKLVEYSRSAPISIRESLMWLIGGLETVREAFEKDFERSQYSEYLLDVVCDVERNLYFVFKQLCINYYCLNIDELAEDAEFIMQCIRNVRELYKIFRV